jgi:SAM-dependent methyltransferase
MPKEPSHPLAEHPNRSVPRRVKCSRPMSDAAFLTTVMLECSLESCSSFVQGLVLDVGCGNRPYEKTFFSGAKKYIGTDYLSDRSRPDIVCSALALPFAADAFDTVVSTEVLEHVPDPAQAMREMQRVLRPGAHLILSTPLYWPRHEAPYDFFRYPYDGMISLVERSGMELVRLYNRGTSYAFLGQVIQHIHPLRSRFVRWWINRCFLFLDNRLRHDVLTMGWTMVARKPPGNVASAARLQRVT